MHKITITLLQELNIPHHAVEEQTLLILICKRDTLAAWRGDAGEHAFGNGGVGGFVDGFRVGARDLREAGNFANGIAR
jgi:hypothetical protein